MATNVTNKIQDINLSETRKQIFRVDGDDSRVLELNTSDLNLLVRLREAYPKLIALSDDAFKRWPQVAETDENLDFMTDPAITATIQILQDVDKKMRELVDYIFDSNVSEVCAPNGSMYDPINGKLRYEYIIECLTSLYETNISSEMKKISKRVQKHTDKYTK